MTNFDHFFDNLRKHNVIECKECGKEIVAFNVRQFVEHHKNRSALDPRCFKIYSPLCDKCYLVHKLTNE